MSDESAILLTAAGTAAGAVASWYFSRQYYLKSGTDLDAAFRQTHQAMSALGHVIEKRGEGKLKYDDAGNITGLEYFGSANLKASGGLTATGTVTKPPPPKYDRQHEQPPAPEPEGDHA
jgi:hypothetical protein